MTDGTPVVFVVNEQTDVDIDLYRWRRLAQAALVSSGATAGELNLLFVDEIEMASLNREHMGEDRVTDVLSFPIDGAGGEPSAGEALIGDVVVCPVHAARQAAGHGGERGHDGSVADELALLIVHGVLHVLGHDHADIGDAARMQAREQDLLAAHHRTGWRPR